MKRKWRTVGVDERLWKRINELTKWFPYGSVGDFISHTCLPRVEELEEELEIETAGKWRKKRVVASSPTVRHHGEAL